MEVDGRRLIPTFCTSRAGILLAWRLALWVGMAWNGNGSD